MKQTTQSAERNGNLSEVQQGLLELLKRFHGICMEHGVHYTLHGGSLLGAIREKGFIPWDDDADVSMTRAEYEKFREILVRMPADEGLYLDETERIQRVFMKQEAGPTVWIDFLNYDPISDVRFFQKCKFAGIMFFGGLLKQKENLRITKLKNNYGRWKYILYACTSRLGSLFPHERKLRWFKWFSSRCFCGKGELIHRSNDQYSAIQMIFPAGVMERYTLVPFEDTELMVSERWHEILLQSYGEDYMTPKRYAGAETEAHEVLREILGDMIGERTEGTPGPRNGRG